MVKIQELFFVVFYVPATLNHPGNCIKALSSAIALYSAAREVLVLLKTLEVVLFASGD